VKQPDFADTQGARSEHFARGSSFPPKQVAPEIGASAGKQSEAIRRSARHRGIIADFLLCRQPTDWPEAKHAEIVRSNWVDFAVRSPLLQERLRALGAGENRGA